MFRYELPDTHNTHAQSYVHVTLFLHVRTMSAAVRLLAAAPNRVTLTRLCCSRLHSQLCCLIVYKVVVYGR